MAIFVLEPYELQSLQYLLCGSLLEKVRQPLLYVIILLNTLMAHVW